MSDERFRPFIWVKNADQDAITRAVRTIKQDYGVDVFLKPKPLKKTETQVESIVSGVLLTTDLTQLDGS